MPKLLFASAVLVMLVFLLRDCLVLPQTAGSLTYLGALFLVLLAPLFGRLWDVLDRRGMDPSKPVKSAFGLLFAGLSFIPLAWAAQHAGATGEVASVWWLVLAYLVLEIGEMCLAPVGLAAVTQLSVQERGQPDDGHLVPRHRVLGNAGGIVRQARGDRHSRRHDARLRRRRQQVRQPVLADDVDRHRLGRGRADRLADAATG